MRLPGWGMDTGQCKTFEELPPAAKFFIRRIERLLGVPVIMVTNGADREKYIPINMSIIEQ